MTAPHKAEAGSQPPPRRGLLARPQGKQSAGDAMTAHDKALVEKVTSELGKHHRTRGLAVSMGTTCACGFWEKGRKQTGGSDGLDSHRAEVALGVAADDLREQGGAGVRAAVEAVLDECEHGADLFGTCSHEWLDFKRIRAALDAPEPGDQT